MKVDYTVQDKVVEGREGRIPIRAYIPDSPTTHSTFLWVHGGGFTGGGLDQRESDAPARALASAGHRVQTIDYRLAPRVSLRGKMVIGPDSNRFPAAHHDVRDVVIALATGNSKPVSLGGASAGANIAAGAALALRDEGLLRLSSLVFAYGTFHADLPDRADVERDLRGPLTKWAFNPAMTHRMNLNYVGSESLLRPGYAFPGGTDLGGLPPTLVLNAKNDRLRRSGDAFANELSAAGVDVDLKVLRGLHGFFGMRKTAAYKAGIRLIADWLDRHDGQIT